MNNLRIIADNIRRSFLNGLPLDTDEFKHFQLMYPKFFNMLTSSNMDKSMYHHLFITLDQLNSGQLNNMAAASTFSSHGADKYVYPTFGKPSSSQLDQATNSIKKHYK